MVRDENGSPWGDAPALVFWEVTRACDLQCRHCRAEAVPDRHPDELTTGEIKRQLEVLGDEMNGVVVFTGGDPFRRPDLSELIETCDHQGLKPALTPSTTPLVTRSRLKELKDAGLRMLALSLDGPDSTRHDRFRGEDGSFRHTMRGFQIADELDVPLQVNTTVCRETFPWIREIGNVLANRELFRWALFFLVRTGVGKRLESISPEETENLFGYLHFWSEEQGIQVKTTNAPFFRRWKLRNADGPSRPGIIDGDGIMFVSHTGDVYPSGFLPVPVGNVKETNPLELYRNDDRFRALRNRDLRGRCGVCEYRRVCGGSRANAFVENGHLLAEDPACQYQPEGYDGARSEERSRPDHDTAQ